MLPKKLRSREKKTQLVKRFDRIFPKSSKKVVLVVKKNTEFSGNLRVCADLLLKKGKHKIFIYKDDDIPVDVRNALEDQGIKILKPNRWRSFYHILTSGVFVFSHVPRDAHLSVKNKSRKILGLWHGVAFKNIESQMLNVPESKMKLIENNAKLYDLMVASSNADKIYIAKSFLVNEKIIDVIGIPRYDLLKPNYLLDRFLENQKNELVNIKGDKKFILYAPTFREKGISAFDQIEESEWATLNDYLKRSDTILGLRPHSYDNKIPPSITKDMDRIVWLSQEKFTESNLVLQFVDLLVVDFSSIWIDYLLLNRPILGFAKDFEHYHYNERGFAYNFEDTFPDVFTHSFQDFLSNLIIAVDSHSFHKNYENSKVVFHQYSLENNFTEMLANSLKQLNVL